MAFDDLPGFQRKFFNSEEELTLIGHGSMGGKAKGLAFIRDVLSKKLDRGEFPEFTVNIPTMTVITTDLFDDFMTQNNLWELANSDLPDDRIAHAFQNTDFPPRLVGDLWSLISKVHSPLAVRSSSLLEDAMFEPFAGIYETKMTPNNQLDAESRFRKLVEAVKFVYASTYFKKAKDYVRATQHSAAGEKMAVIIQEVVGQRHSDRYYPHISGVGRSYNFYPLGHAEPEEGIVSLALGLGKMIVDEGMGWSYSPQYPRANPPFSNINDMLKHTQREFWAVNMGKPPAFDPVRETEYLVKGDLVDAEKDEVLRYAASTYDSQSDQIYPGMAGDGPRILNFAPLLQLEEIRLNELVKNLLRICEESLAAPVEIEFAVTLEPGKEQAARFGFLQVRPMVVSAERVEIDPGELSAENLLLASESVMGNGHVDDIQDVVFVKPEGFDARYTSRIAAELEGINQELMKGKIPYLLIGFGRWGSSDKWLGIPVNWGQISGARVIVESTLPEMNVDLSQGTHFFHNISSFRVSYFSMHHAGKYNIDWDWLNSRKPVTETQYVKHVKLDSPLHVKVDGRTGRGIIAK